MLCKWLQSNLFELLILIPESCSNTVKGSYFDMNSMWTTHMRLYLKEPYEPTRTLCSQHAGLLVVPSIFKGRTGGRAFSYQAPLLWNHLPDLVRGADTLLTFKSRLKTFLFDKAYSWGQFQLLVNAARGLGCRGTPMMHWAPLSSSLSLSLSIHLYPLTFMFY